MNAKISIDQILQGIRRHEEVLAETKAQQARRFQEQVGAVEFLLAQQQILAPDGEGFALDSMTLEALTESIRILGSREATQILLGRMDEDEAVEGKPLVAGDDLGAYILSFIGQKQAPLKQLIASIGSDLWPMVAGAGTLPPTDPSQPEGILATNIRGVGRLTWVSERFRKANAIDLVLSQLSEGPDLVREKGAVWFENGRICVNTSEFPEEGRWQLFCLAPEPENRLLRLIPSQCEVFCLRRPVGTASGWVEAKDLVTKGFLVESWRAGLEESWSSARLLRLIYLIHSCSVMLTKQEITATSGASAAIAMALRDQTFAKWVENIFKSSFRRIQSIQQSLVEVFRRS